MGDYGVVGIKPCKCAFGNLGFYRYINKIRSFEKLTGEGVTFVDTDFIRIIEYVLPSKFGGEATDYQLIEEEDTNGFTYLSLLVSPRLRKIDERAVVEEFLRLLKEAEDSPDSWSQTGSQMWAQVNTIRVKREYPIPTKRAKILPFHIMKA
jgi:hypothetical protein